MSWQSSARLPDYRLSRIDMERYNYLLVTGNSMTTSGN